MPISISTLSKIGGNAITIAPSAAACMLIRPISMPVWRSSWNVSDSCVHVVEQVAAQVEDDVLLDLRVHVVVDHAHAVARPIEIRKPRPTMKTSSR